MLAEELDAAPIHIGKLLVFWRLFPKREKVSEDRMAGPRDVKVLKNSSRYGQRLSLCGCWATSVSHRAAVVAPSRQQAKRQETVAD
jgi:hypothetical protein